MTTTIVLATISYIPRLKLNAYAAALNGNNKLMSMFFNSARINELKTKFIASDVTLLY